MAGGSDGKASAWNAGDLGSIPGLGRSSGEENGSPLQYACLENSMDWGAWWATVHGVAKSWTKLSDFTFTAQLKSFITKLWGAGLTCELLEDKVHDHICLNSWYLMKNWCSINTCWIKTWMDKWMNECCASCSFRVESGILGSRINQ